MGVYELVSYVNVQFYMKKNRIAKGRRFYNFLQQPEEPCHPYFCSVLPKYDLYIGAI